MKDEVKAAQELQAQSKRERAKMMALIEEKEHDMRRAIDAEQVGRTREQKLTAHV